MPQLLKIEGSTEGWESDTKETTKYAIRVGQVTVNVIDTCGTMDVTSDASKKFENLVDVVRRIVETGKGEM